MRSLLARWIVPLSCLALLVPSLVSARVTDATSGLSATGRTAGLSTACSGSATTCIATMLGRALNILLGFLGIILLGYVLYGGFVWMTASGSKEVDQAQGIIRNAVIGVVIIASSFAISNFVLTELGRIATGSTDGGTGTTNADGTTSVDSIADGAARLCCYSGSTPATDCRSDCLRTPATFGVPTTGDATAACTTACNSRLCGATGPVAGQTICKADDAPGPVAWTREASCIAIMRETPSGACNTCVHTCMLDSLCRMSPIYRATGIASDTDVTNVRVSCHDITCTDVAHGRVCTL